VATMVLGLYMTQLALPSWCRIAMVVYGCFHSVIEMTLAIHMHANKCCAPASSESALPGTFLTYCAKYTVIHCVEIDR